MSGVNLRPCPYKPCLVKFSYRIYLLYISSCTQIFVAHVFVHAHFPIVIIRVRNTESAIRDLRMRTLILRKRRKAIEDLRTKICDTKKCDAKICPRTRQTGGRAVTRVAPQPIYRPVCALLLALFMKGEPEMCPHVAVQCCSYMYATVKWSFIH